MFGLVRSSSGVNLNAGTGYPCGHAPPPAQNSILDMIGFERNCPKKNKWKIEKRKKEMTCAKFFRRALRRLPRSPGSVLRSRVVSLRNMFFQLRTSPCGCCA